MTKSTLLSIPKELLLPHENNQTATSVTSVIAPQDTSKMFFALARTCKQMHTLFQPELDKFIKKKFTELLSYIRQANIQEARAIYSIYPDLLFKNSQDFKKDDHAMSDSAHESPYVLALTLGDFDMLKDMATYFDKIRESSANGYQLAANELKRKIESEFFNPYQDYSYDFSLLIKTIRNDSSILDTGIPSEETVSQLMKFKADFELQARTQAPNFKLKAITHICHKIGTTFRAYSLPQLGFIWCQVIGYLQTLVVNIDAYAARHGMRSLVDDKNSYSKADVTIIRDFEQESINLRSCYNKPQKNYLVSDVQSDDFRLGRDFALDHFGRAVTAQQIITTGFTFNYFDSLNSAVFGYMNSKKEDCEKLDSEYNQMLNNSYKRI